MKKFIFIQMLLHDGSSAEMIEWEALDGIEEHFYLETPDLDHSPPFTIESMIELGRHICQGEGINPQLYPERFIRNMKIAFEVLLLEHNAYWALPRVKWITQEHTMEAYEVAQTRFDTVSIRKDRTMMIEEAMKEAGWYVMAKSRKLLYNEPIWYILQRDNSMCWLFFREKNGDIQQLPIIGDNIADSYDHALERAMELEQ